MSPIMDSSASMLRSLFFLFNLINIVERERRVREEVAVTALFIGGPVAHYLSLRPADKAARSKVLLALIILGLVDEDSVEHVGGVGKRVIMPLRNVPGRIG